MIALYIDCDGTILNTITPLEEGANANGVDLKNRNKAKRFLSSFDWETLLNNAEVLNDGINSINRIINFGLYMPAILTHVNSDKEAWLKEKYFHKYIPNIKIYVVSADIPKADYIPAVKGKILVDDYKNNLYYWQEKGGLAVKFDMAQKPNKDLIVINNLDYFITNYEETKSKIKTLIKKKNDKY